MAQRGVDQYLVKLKLNKITDYPCHGHALLASDVTLTQIPGETFIRRSQSLRAFRASSAWSTFISSRLSSSVCFICGGRFGTGAIRSCRHFVCRGADIDQHKGVGFQANFLCDLIASKLILTHVPISTILSYKHRATGRARKQVPSHR